MSAQLNSKVLGFTKAAGQALSIAQKLLAEKKARDKAAADRVPDLVSRLKKAGLISDNAVKQASDELSNHKMALDILSKVIDVYVNTKQAVKSAEAVNTGVAVPDSQASKSSNVKNANYVGARLGENEFSDADVRFVERMLAGRRN